MTRNRGVDREGGTARHPDLEEEETEEIPVATSHTRILESELQEMRYCPSGWKKAAQTASVWPMKVREGDTRKREQSGSKSRRMASRNELCAALQSRPMR